MKKLLALLLLPLGAFALTPIADTIYTASGGTAGAGSYLVIKWPRFTSSGSHAVPPNVQTVPLANGTFSVSLESTATAQFPFQYTVEYHLMSAGEVLPVYTETWDVPDTAMPQRIASVVVVTPAPLPAPAAKGDLSTSDGVSPVRLPAPAVAGYVLQTDPTQAAGLAWASISSLGANFDAAGAAATAQSNAKTYTDTAIAGLSSVYDAAGAAVAAQTAARAYTDSAVAGISSGVTSSQVNSAIAAAISGLNLLSASQHAASDFDSAGTATAAVSGIPTASASVNGLLSQTDWAAFNGKQNAIPANTYDAYGAAATAQANAISGAQTNANTAIAALNLKSASQHLSSDFDAAGAAASAVAAIPSSGSSQTNRALITPTDWATFNSKQGALGFTPENSAKKGAASGYAPLDAGSNVPVANLGNLGSAAFQTTSAFDAAGSATTAQSAAQSFATSSINALGLKSASQHLATDFDAAGAAASAIAGLPMLTPKPPYLFNGTSYFIASTGQQVTTTPASLSLSYLPFTATTAAITPGPNGDLLIGDPSNTGAYYYGTTASSSIEAEFTIGGSANNGANAGIYVYDAAHSFLWVWTYYSSGINNSISVVSYNGTAAPGTSTGEKSFNSVFQGGVISLKITLVSGRLHFWFSTNGGATWIDYFDGAFANSTLVSAGLYVKGFYADYYNVAIN